MLTEKQKEKIWEAGTWDEHANEILMENASYFIEKEMNIDRDKEDFDEAIEIYCKGFMGESYISSDIEERFQDLVEEIKNAELTQVNYQYLKECIREL